MVLNYFCPIGVSGIKGKMIKYFTRDNGTNCVEDVPISEINGHTDEYFSKIMGQNGQILFVNMR